MSLGTTSRLSGNQLEDDGSSVSGPGSLYVLWKTGDEVEVVCNPIRMGRWYDLMVVCVCHLDEVMRETDANDISGEL